MTDAYVPLTGPPTWHHAACRGEDPDLWFPLQTEPPIVNRYGETAVDICRRCPHTAECVAFAVKTNSRDGIWGGLTPEERRTATGQRQSEMNDRQRLAAYTEARRREQVGKITTLGTRRLAEMILASLPRDPLDVIAARRVELEQAIYSNRYHARRKRRKQAEREGK